MSVTRHRGHWTPDDRCASPYHYLPVPVPPGTAGLRVRLDYDRSAAVLDLGCFGPAGFRGWSGGARPEFVITAGQATPGYLPGELEPGEWLVALGLYQLPAAGAGYTVTAELTSTPGRFRPAPTAAPPGPLSARPPRRELPARPGHRWLAGDLHAHTVHSDGALTVPQLARLAAEQGLDFLAVTDHNTVSHHAELGWASARYGVTLIPGQEVTTDSGHAGALGDLGWVDFREPADSMAGRDRAWRWAAVGQPPDWRARQLAEADAAQATAGRGVALELAGPPLDQHDGLVAGLGPGRGPGRRQRLAPARLGRRPGHADHLGGMRRRRRRPRRWLEAGRAPRTASPGCWPGCGTDDAPSLPGGTARCCSGWTASSPRSAGTAPSWPARTARAPWCAATWPGSPPPPAATGCSTRPAAPWPSPASGAAVAGQARSPGWALLARRAVPPAPWVTLIMASAFFSRLGAFFRMFCPF